MGVSASGNQGLSFSEQLDLIDDFAQRERDAIEGLYQVRPLRDTEFAEFLVKRGFDKPSIDQLRRLMDKGWLATDGAGTFTEDGIHPFRLLSYAQCMRAVRISDDIERARREGSEQVAQLLVGLNRFDPDLGRQAREWSSITQLAIACEPAYWPLITSRSSWRAGTYEEYLEDRKQYHARLKNLVLQLEPELWKNVHGRIVLSAEDFDENEELYLLLRLSPWEKRERLVGHISGSLWLRHIAEVIRRAFEEAHGVRWPEEDNFFHHWVPGARALTYGTARPLDDVPEARLNLSADYGFATGASVRWYVEGETEYFAIKEAFGEPARSGIELQNLAGGIVHPKDNFELKLRGMLEKDKELRRLSMISIDRVPETAVTFVKGLVKDRLVVGRVFVADPDFEYANFTIEELKEVAARLVAEPTCEGRTGDADAVRNGDFGECTNGEAFCERASKLALVPGIKGERWGRALAQFAMESPEHPETGRPRPFVAACHTAIRCRRADYLIEAECWAIDPETLELKQVKSVSQLMKELDERERG